MKSTLQNDDRDLVRSPLSGALRLLARRASLRRAACRIARKLEGGSCTSWTARAILGTHQGVEVGAHSYGPCVFPGAFPPGVTIGRYVSVGPGVRVFRRNHPMERLSMHPYFYNRELGLVEEDTIESRPLAIDHEAWIGENAIITPGCERIGIGAVIGAGAVVTKDVDDFAIVAGNPAKVIRTRFDEATIERLLESAWWERSKDEFARFTSELTRPLDEEALRAIGAPSALGEEVALCA